MSTGRTADKSLTDLFLLITWISKVHQVWGKWGIHDNARNSLLFLSIFILYTI